MTSLNELVQDMGFKAIPFVKEHKASKRRWLKEQSPLFTKVCKNKPTTAPALHLLGLLTKSHIEASALYEQHAHSAQKMQQVLTDSLGDEHAGKFTNQSAEDLILITHLWLYTQGYLNMDFSLAHDHAEQTQNTLQYELVIKYIDVDLFRTELMQSFYLGREANPTSNSGFLGWLKRLLTL
ncbi:hypothetical protein ATG66_0964 [Vibrio sp. ES.051]|uniref:hypothetical protein n=1 Tax=Vibrio sp. ES.051 TaxID=1761909 RepID=UPI000BF6D5D0|nr:hypothetical protein [Vibrio sp. ES.051]PFG58414.1 hypothetical protein ATG66_0964 [Vibrio sp. ES.051]